MTTSEAMRLIAGELSEELVICTTGYTSRDMQAIGDRAANFYMIGSMGLAAPIGLGVALNQSKKKVLVFDGDGAVLMGLGVLSMIGGLRPRNLIHLVFDNEVFASTGEQPTYSRSSRLEAMAEAAGYSYVCKAESPQEVRSKWQECQEAEGPVFFLIKCRADSQNPGPRVQLAPDAISSRFMEAVKA